MASIPELLAAYESTESLAEAEGLLDQLSALDPPGSLGLGDYYDDLAEIASENEDFSLAVRAQRRAIELDCEYLELGREMLAWYLLKAGEREEGEAAFAKLRAERDEDPQVAYTLAQARQDSGDVTGALKAFDEALDLAKRVEDGDWLDEIRAERRYCRDEQGLAPDDEDLLAGEIHLFHPVACGSTGWALAWFPRDQIEAALARWPSLADDLNDPDEYCRSMERRLRVMLRETGSEPIVSPLRVEQLIEYAEANDLHPDSGSARSHFAAELARTGEAISWPPGRNEPCWCGSGRKYKRCCG